MGKNVTPFQVLYFNGSFMVKTMDFRWFSVKGGDKKCRSEDPSAGLGYCLTRMMDCRELRNLLRSQCLFFSCFLLKISRWWTILWVNMSPIHVHGICAFVGHKLGGLGLQRWAQVASLRAPSRTTSSGIWWSRADGFFKPAPAMAIPVP